MSAPTTRDVRVLTALARRIDRQNPVALTNFAWLAARAGHPSTGLAAARRAVTLPGTPKAAWRTLERLAVGHTDGLLLARSERISDASVRSRTSSSLTAAVRAHKQGAHAVAEACYQAATAEAQSAAAAYNGMAVLHRQRGEIEPANRVWQHSLESPSVAALHNRALSWIQDGESERADLLFSEHLVTVENSAPLLFLKGYLAWRNNDLSDARYTMEAARSLDLNLARADFTLALVYERMAEHESALNAIRRALLVSPWYLPQVWLLQSGTGDLVELVASGESLDPQPSADGVLLSLGRSLLEAGHLGESLAVFDQVLLNQPEHTAALFHRGVVLAKLRRYHEALDDWETVERNDDGGELAAVSARHVRSARRLAKLFSNG